MLYCKYVIVTERGDSCIPTAYTFLDLYSDDLQIPVSEWLVDNGVCLMDQQDKCFNTYREERAGIRNYLSEDWGGEEELGRES